MCVLCPAEPGRAADAVFEYGREALSMATNPRTRNPGDPALSAVEDALGAGIGELVIVGQLVLGARRFTAARDRRCGLDGTPRFAAPRWRGNGRSLWTVGEGGGSPAPP